jgi:DNA repair exonuclease SbcCD nuclease subunit
MTVPYALVADVHAHSWSQFSQMDSEGVNTRLRTILSELVRCAEELKQAGGTVLRVAGDLFHVRGHIAPSVFNPTFECFKQIAQMGVDIEIIPGNHDLEGKDTTKLGNAMQQLLLIEGCHVITETEATDDGATVMIPWIECLDDLRAECAKHADPDRDLIIHAPLNGVIKGIPDHGLDPDELAKLGYRRVFVGHYHNHKEFTGGVYSIGATTHQTWSDPGTLAGFLLVYPDRVEHRPTAAPQFMNVDDLSDITPRMKNNFCRMRFKNATEDDLKKAKAALEKVGAAGVVDHSTRKREVTRGVSSPTNVTLEVSVANFVSKHLQVDSRMNRKKIAVAALDILSEARMVGDE